MTALVRRPLVPEDRDRHGKRAFATSFVHAAVASLIAANSKGIQDRDDIAARLWPADRDIPTVLKAASAPADTVTPGWAGALAPVGAIVDLLNMLAPSSAGVALLRACLSFNWPVGVNGLSVPALDANAAYAQWIAQAAPFPVIDLASSRVTVNPKKIGCIVTYSRETFSYSTPQIEQLVRLAISESLSLALDARLFSSTAADATSPPGLFVGISALTPSNNSIPSEALASDVAELVAAVSAVSGNSPIILVASPRQAAALRVRTTAVEFPTFSSPALADKSVAAIASNALFSVGDDAPRFDASIETLLHMADAPAQIGTPGSPNVVAAPTRSLYQTDVVALKMRFSINWALRNSAGVAWISGTNW
jgi:hypothetical protein